MYWINEPLPLNLMELTVQNFSWSFPQRKAGKAIRGQEKGRKAAASCLVERHKLKLNGTLGVMSVAQIACLSQFLPILPPILIPERRKKWLS